MQTLTVLEYGKDYRSTVVFCVLQFAQQTPFDERQLTHLVRFEQGQMLPEAWTATDLRDAVAAQLTWNPELIEFSTEYVGNPRVGSA
jgi:hypothetical protein